MDSDQECQQKVAENFWREEEQKDEKDFRLKLTMIKLESLKKNSHFGIVLKRRVINNDFFTIYRAKNFIKNIDGRKKIYISFVIRKKVGNAAKRNRIKRKFKSIVRQLLKINSAINSNYTYIIFGKAKAYEEHSKNLLIKMKKSFREIDSVRS
tara:strand:- start:209 stop:667 length:459 start_codon:yes stop_codon:yes gene_type:complete